MYNGYKGRDWTVNINLMFNSWNENSKSELERGIIENDWLWGTIFMWKM